MVLGAGFHLVLLNMAAKAAEPVEGCKPRPCDLCRSPYRREIEKLIYGGEMTIPAIARKYSTMLQKKLQRTINLMRSHKRDNHKDLVPNQVYGAKATYNNNTPNLNADRKKILNFELAAEQLLAIGMEGASDLSPKEALSLAAQLQKTHLEGRKVKVSEDSLKLTAAKFFGGFLGGKVEEGEVIDNGVNPPLSLPVE